MKIKIIAMIISLLMGCFCITGCAKNPQINEVDKANAYPENVEAGTYEWVSPDGVHYWIYIGFHLYGMAPRYDSNGKLVIDEKE